MANKVNEAGNLEDFRAAVFEEMGFSQDDARKLAESRGPDGWPVDTHKVQKMILGGCSTELALKIVL